MDRGKFRRMASTVLDDGHALKRQATVKTQASLRKDQSLSNLLVTEPSAVFDNEPEDLDSDDEGAP